LLALDVKTEVASAGTVDDMAWMLGCQDDSLENRVHVLN
jgi:hypothetical protein